MSSVFRVFLEKLGGADATTFVGNAGELFFDPTSATLRISDGATPGGTVLSGASGLNLSQASDTLFNALENGDGIVFDGTRFTNQPAQQETFISAVYKFKHATSALPNSGEFQFNASIIANATAAYLHEETLNDVDLSNLFVAFAGHGKVLYVQDKDNADNFHLFRLDGEVTKVGTRVHVPVAHIEGGGKMSDNQKCMLGVIANSISDSIVPVAAPATPTTTGTAGQIRFSGDHLYICVADNTWKRADLSTWS